MFNLILFGPPGSGKGTQSENIIAAFGLQHLSTGNLLRSEITNQTPLGLKAKTLMDAGQLVPDEVVIGMVDNFMSAHPEAKGFLFDGFPRTIPQAEALIAAGINIDLVIEINVSDNVIIERLGGRRVHPTSGRIYHVKYSPPKTEGIDDITGEPLIIRDDDYRETIVKRLDTYHQQTEPLINFYKNSSLQNKTDFIEVDGEKKPEEINHALENLLNK